MTLLFVTAVNLGPARPGEISEKLTQGIWCTVYQSVSNVGQWHCGTTKEDEGTQRTHTAHTWSNEVTIRQLPAICYVLAFLD